jgi:hypothetical protein
MDEIHRMMRDVPPVTYALMVGIPLVMVVAAVGLGWYAQAAQPSDDRRSPRAQSQALGAGITVAVVPLAFAILMLWSRFG